jgi:hypothetical protein
MTKYNVYVHKTITEYWTVEADSEEDARLYYYVLNGEHTGTKEHDKDVDVYED